MKRAAEKYLGEWKTRQDRKPLILRGARQTGKTYIVDKFGQNHFENLIKIDFEFDPSMQSIFATRDPQTITNEISLYYDIDIIPGQTLLFLDEIQACPEAIAALRYFYEKMPSLHVIAAGSLLDFALRDFRYSMPVGRIEFLYIFPLSFDEFLLSENPRLHDFINNWHYGIEISDAIHQKLAGLLRDFFFTGGMPEAVASWIKNKNVMEVLRIQSAILTTMQNDFAKYGSRKYQSILQKVLYFIPRHIGKKVKYVSVDRNLRSGELKEAFQLLEMSRIIHLVYKTNGNGIPLGAEKNPSIYKPVFLDIGLVNRACRLKLTALDQLITVYEGGLAEQFAGQELLSSGLKFESPNLYYWTREAKNANAEVDYLLSHESTILPVEIKAGKTGSLKSLHIFLYEKQLRYGLRLNMDQPSIGDFKTKVRVKKINDELGYTLISLPLYLAGQITRILEDIL